MKKRIVSWIKKEVKNSRAKGIVLGLSGGIDSSVVVSLAKEAVGRKNVLGLLMPCHSHGQDSEHAKLIVRKLKIKTKTVDLSNIYDNLLRLLPKAKGLAPANLRPRLRMMVLYYFANKMNYLVAGTGNKSEAMVGYFTKYGDGGVDILPIADLLKTQVRKLAKELGVPEPIITKPPTAGLWPGQTDEGEMGITYPELDSILGALEIKKRQTVSIVKVNKVKKMMRNSEHKRLGPKICYIK